jgi:hypothetical protein
MDRLLDDIVSYWMVPNHLEVFNSLACRKKKKRPIATLMNINELEYQAPLRTPELSPLHICAAKQFSVEFITLQCPPAGTH